MLYHSFLFGEIPKQFQQASSINCLIVICLPTVCFIQERSLQCGPRVYFPSYIFISIKPNQKYVAIIHLLLLYVMFKAMTQLHKFHLSLKMQQQLLKNAVRDTYRQICRITRVSCSIMTCGLRIFCNYNLIFDRMKYVN